MPVQVVVVVPMTGTILSELANLHTQMAATGKGRFSRGSAVLCALCSDNFDPFASSALMYQDG